MIACPVHKKFDLIFGTSTGAIIGTLLSLGWSVENICKLYEEHVPEILGQQSASAKSAELKKLADTTFSNATFQDMKTYIGIVSTDWNTNKPMIFKNSPLQAHRRVSTFSPGFGVTVSDAIQASCSAFPYFNRKIINTSHNEQIELIDGGYCANNPTLYAISEANKFVSSINFIRVVSLGVGRYPTPKISFLKRVTRKEWWAAKIFDAELTKKAIEMNSESMDSLRNILFSEISSVRIDEAFETDDMATDMFETNQKKLRILKKHGRDSFAKYEPLLRSFLT